MLARQLFERRKKRVRYRLKLYGGRLRLSVFRSNQHIYAQIIDDANQKTLVQASTVDKELVEQVQKLSSTDAAKKVGELIGRRAKEAKIKHVVFDRGGYLYHGRIQALADAAREAGLEF